MKIELEKLMAQLIALEEHLPSDPVPRDYADEFNSILVGIEQETRENLGDFVVREEKINPMVIGVKISGEKICSSKEYCERSFILMKIRGALLYLASKNKQVDDQEEKIGF